MNHDPALLQAALVGYQSRLAQIDQAMADIRQRLGRAKGGSPNVAKLPKRKLSAAARKRMSAAQRKRWAEYKKAKQPVAKKRRMSAAGRKRIADAARKRWADYRAKKAAMAKEAAPVAKRATITPAKPPAVKEAVARPAARKRTGVQGSVG